MILEALEQPSLESLHILDHAGVLSRQNLSVCCGWRPPPWHLRAHPRLIKQFQSEPCRALLASALVSGDLLTLNELFPS